MALRSVTVRLDEELVERLLNAVWHQRSTISAALAAEFPAIVERLEAANGGKPYPPREGDLPTQTLWADRTKPKKKGKKKGGEGEGP